MSRGGWISSRPSRSSRVSRARSLSPRRHTRRGCIQRRARQKQLGIAEVACPDSVPHSNSAGLFLPSFLSVNIPRKPHRHSHNYITNTLTTINITTISLQSWLKITSLQLSHLSTSEPTTTANPQPTHHHHHHHHHHLLLLLPPHHPPLE